MAMHALVPAAGIKGQLFSVKQLISNWKESDLLTWIGPADVHLPVVREDNSRSLELCLSLTCDHRPLCLCSLPDSLVCWVQHTQTCPGAAHAQRAWRGQQCGAGGWELFLTSTPVKSSRKMHVPLSNHTCSGAEFEVVVRAQDRSETAWLERAEAGPCHGGDWISSPGSL